MVAEHVTGKGFGGALDYQEQNQKISKGEIQEHQRPELIEVNNVYGSSKDISRQMRYQAQERERVKKPVGHLIVSFPAGEKLSKAQEVKAVKSVMDETNIKDTQYRIMKHNDTSYSHYHVIYNRVNNSGELIKDGKIKDRLQVACSKVEREQGLQSHDHKRTCVYNPTNEKGYSYQKLPQDKHDRQAQRVIDSQDKNTGVQEHRAEVWEIVNNEMQTTYEPIPNSIEEKRKHGASSPEELKQRLAKKSVQVDFKANSKGINGIVFRYKGRSVKGSQIGYKWNDCKMFMNRNERLKTTAQEYEQKKAQKQERPQYSEMELKNLGQETNTRIDMKRPPTSKEIQEIQAKGEYLKASRQADKDFISVYQKNETADISQIMEKNGFKYDAEKQQYYFSSNGYRINHDIRPYNRQLERGKQMRITHEKANQNLAKVESLEYRKETTFFVFKSAENRQYNEKLKQEKTRAEKQVEQIKLNYKDIDSELGKEKNIRTSYESRVIQERLEEIRQEQAEQRQSRSQEENRNRGMRM